MATSYKQGREFEFISDDEAREFIIFPADEHFYQGKILPLHHAILLQNSTPTPLAQPCNITPSESLCITSHKLNDYFFTQLSDENFIVRENPRKSWPKKKLKLIKKLIDGQNLMAYRAHLKSFLSESSCTSESFTIASPKKRQVIKKMSKPVKCLSSSSSQSSLFSSSSSSSDGQNLHKSRDSFGSDTEGSIDAAIAHCKKSQEKIDDTESGYWSFSVKNCRLH